MNKTVLFLPLNSPGHINSLLSVADGLKKDYGCRTIFALAGLTVDDGIQKHGHELIVIEEKRVHEDYEIDSEGRTIEGSQKKKFPGAFKWPQLVQRSQHLLKLDPLAAMLQSFEIFEKLMSSEIIDVHDSLVKLINETIRPGLIVVDAYFIHPSVVMMENEIPWVRIFSANPMQIIKPKSPGAIKPPASLGYRLYNKEIRENMRQREPSRWQEILDSWKSANDKIIQKIRTVGSELSEFINEQNCRPINQGEQTHDSLVLNLYIYPKAIDYDQDDDLFSYSPRWMRCDSLVRQRPVGDKQFEVWGRKLDEAIAKLGGQREIIYFSLGSIASGVVTLMKKYVDIFKQDSERLYVVSKGVNGDKYDLAPNMIGGNFIPQTFFLQKANLAIIHGGNNSLTECLYHGVPMLILPVFADQLDNGQRIQDLDLGRTLNVHEATPVDINRAISEILNDKRLIEKNRKIGEQMRTRDDSSKISFIFNKILEEKQISQEFIEKCRDKDLDEILSS